MYSDVCSEVRPGVIPFNNLHDLRVSNNCDRRNVLLTFPPRPRRLPVGFSQEYDSPLRLGDEYMCMVSRQVPMLERLELIGRYFTQTSLMCIREFRHLKILDLLRLWEMPPPTIPRDLSVTYLYPFPN